MIMMIRNIIEIMIINVKLLIVIIIIKIMIILNFYNYNHHNHHCLILMTMMMMMMVVMIMMMMGQASYQNFVKEKTGQTDKSVLGGCICESCCTLSGSGPMLGGFSPEGSRIILNPDTMLLVLAAKNFEMLHVQPYWIASLAAILNF